jgi:hypothetical protein
LIAVLIRCGTTKAEAHPQVNLIVIGFAG